MGHRKTYNEVDFSDFNDIIIYAYGSSRIIKSKKDVERLFLAVKERIYKDNIDSFRERHSCKECHLFISEECKANGYCRFDKHRRLLHKSKINGCPHNNYEPCCYANESGTCFGYCYRNQVGLNAKNKEQMSGGEPK